MVRQHYRLNGHESEQTLGDGDGQEAWHGAVHGVTELDMTEQLNKNKYLLNSQTGPGTLMAAESTKILPSRNLWSS